MSRVRIVLRVAGCVGLALLAVGVLAAMNVGPLVNFAMTARIAFDAEPPPPPDYGSGQPGGFVDLHRLGHGAGRRRASASSHPLPTAA